MENQPNNHDTHRYIRRMAADLLFRGSCLLYSHLAAAHDDIAQKFGIPATSRQFCRNSAIYGGVHRVVRWRCTKNISSCSGMRGATDRVVGLKPCRSDLNTRYLTTYFLKKQHVISLDVQRNHATPIIISTHPANIYRF